MSVASVPLTAKQPAPRGASSARALRRLFLTLFLRGRSSRGLSKDKAPRSVARLLRLTLLFYGLFGLFALSLLHQPVQVLATYLHASTFLFIAMYVAASGGEILFNKEEADILLHRPVTPNALLQAKMLVLVEVSLWLAGAFNITGLLIGTFGPGGSWRFPLAHAFSIALEALFCTGCVVLAYQLCLRWLGRERFESLMTTVQVLVAVTLVLSAQLLPRMIAQLGNTDSLPAWSLALPPSWFAAIDDALAGSGATRSWLLGGVAVLMTAAIVWLATQRLASHYITGLQQLTVTSSAKPRSGVLRWSKLLDVPPFTWWLRSGAARTAFVLVFAYMVRNREVKLRLYPSIAPTLVIPFLMLWQTSSNSAGSGFIFTFAGVFIGMVPMLSISLLRYCEHWQASDIFRIAPLAGPAQLCAGARVAVLTLMAPVVLGVVAALALLLPDHASSKLMLPGIVLLPIYAMIPCVGGRATPLSQPAEEAKSANRGLLVMGMMIGSFVISGLAFWTSRLGYFWEFMLVESLAVVVVYALMRRSLARTPWPSME
jgi:hypothetical protein